MQNHPTNDFKGLKHSVYSTILALYITMGITSLALGYKLVAVGPFLVSGAAFILPFRYLLGDILAEVYGYQLAKQQIWNLLLAGFVFCLLIHWIIKLPSPPYWTQQAAFNFVLGNTLHIAIVASASLLIGATVNIYILTKFGILIGRRCFYLRAFFSSAAGELVQYIIGQSILYYNILTPAKICRLIISDYTIQLCFILILTFPFTILMYVLKKIEKIDVYENTIDFNPFKIN